MPQFMRSSVFLRFLSLLVLLMGWQIAAWLVNSSILPGPVRVMSRVGKDLLSGELLDHLGVTLFRVLLSFALAMLIGTAVGMLMGRWRKADDFLDAWLVIGLNIPALVTIILCYIWLGLTEFAAVTAVAINKIPTVIVTVREGARAVDRALLQVAQAFRLNYSRTLFKVYLPQLYPYLMAAARSGLSLIWKIVLVVELLGRSDGIGFQLGIFFQFFDITGILAYTLVFAAVVLMVEAWIMRPLDRRIGAWR